MDDEAFLKSTLIVVVGIVLVFAVAFGGLYWNWVRGSDNVRAVDTSEITACHTLTTEHDRSECLLEVTWDQSAGVPILNAALSKCDLGNTRYIVHCVQAALNGRDIAPPAEQTGKG